MNNLLSVELIFGGEVKPDIASAVVGVSDDVRSVVVEADHELASCSEGMFDMLEFHDEFCGIVEVSFQVSVGGLNRSVEDFSSGKCDNRNADFTAYPDSEKKNEE